MTSSEKNSFTSVSVIIPVYAGALTLPRLAEELLATQRAQSPKGRCYEIVEVLLVDDNGPDDSASTIRRIESETPLIRGVWLSRNFGQHAATLAGISQSKGEWVVTLDEDGQHDPRFIGHLLDACIDGETQTAYGDPNARLRQRGFRGTTSRGAKSMLARWLGNPEAPKYQSFRLIDGPLARSVSASVGPGTFLDVALGWVSRPAASVPVTPRTETERPSTYSLSRLLRHFTWLVLTSGIQGLRLVTLLGALSAVLGVIVAVWILAYGLATGWYPAGWASTYVTYLLGNGAVLLAVGVTAEYIGAIVARSHGKPPYHIVANPTRGPLRASSESKEES